ncbi:hypothetical protein DRN74_01215 [Candidatus Micrarchaeota archaeon]|nr:MAG: hypothetical protein DRN74_01215 [Candidatus Micrarchaeota archaeon]
MLKLKLRLKPIRIIIKQRQPAILDICIKNAGELSALVSLKAKLSQQLSFDRGGLIREERRRIGYIKPGMEKHVPLNVFARPTAEEGFGEIMVAAFEHEDDRYDKVKETVSAKTELRLL